VGVIREYEAVVEVGGMADGTLRHLAGVQEIDIGFRRPDGSSGSTPVWVVEVDDEYFVRCMNGPRGGWYRRLRANPDGEVREHGHVHPIHAEHVTQEETLAAVTRAYQDKYGASPYLRPFLGRDSIDATLRLEPR
jgi:hypothetical protein